MDHEDIAQEMADLSNLIDQAAAILATPEPELAARLATIKAAARGGCIVNAEPWNRWAPNALHSPLAPAELVAAYNRWQPDHLKIRRSR